jgi:hypothetical protein
VRQLRIAQAVDRFLRHRCALQHGGPAPGIPEFDPFDQKSELIL